MGIAARPSRTRHHIHNCARRRGPRSWRVDRKTIKTRGSFPDEDSARKLLYLAITRAQRKWRHTYNWSSALAAFRIHFADRIPDTAS